MTEIKCVIVVDGSLPMGTIANTAPVIGPSDENIIDPNAVPSLPHQREINVAGRAQGIPTYIVTEQEAHTMLEAIETLGVPFKHADVSGQLRMAKFVATHMRLAAPGLSGAIAGAMTKLPIQRIRGVPVVEEGAELMATVLSLLRGGEVFQYYEQLDGKLTGPIEPKAGGAPNSNASPDPFGVHTDDAIMPKPFRVEEIALLGVYNPAGTLTGFALLEAIL